MAEHPRPARDTMTLGSFIEEAANASGGMEVLRRRMGVSKASIEDMSVSANPLSADDVTALSELLGLSLSGTAEVSDEQGRRGAPGHR